LYRYAAVKFDIETGERQVYEHGEGRYGMEAQFVPRGAAGGGVGGALNNSGGAAGAGGCGGGGGAEDDGWLVLYVHDESEGKDAAAEGRSECVVLDARDIEAGPVARIVLPSRVPYGAHALWQAAASVSSSSTEHNNYSTDVRRSGGGGGAIAAEEGGNPAGLGAAGAAAAAIKASPPTPRMFAIAEGQLGALLGTVRTGVLRAAAGLFVNGWRPWFGADDAGEYAFLRAFGLRFTEARALGAVREEQAREELAAEETVAGPGAGAAGAGPDATTTGGADLQQMQQLAAPALTLYELEGCGASRRVREALCMLDLACTLKPCPHGAVRNRLAAAAAQTYAAAVVGGIGGGGDTFCAEDAELPYLEDARTGVTLTGADAIVEYLYLEYLDGAAPSPLVAPGPFAAARAQLAVDARGAEDSGYGPTPFRRGPAGAFYSRPSVAPARPLELWAYEASPFCAVVREALSEMEISYVMRPTARGSPRRTALMRRTGGTFQVPYLEDPNTGVAMFESAEIVRYLRSTYLP
jgi:glutathione S-transferase